MGLDMYAYAIDAGLIDATQVTDVSLGRIARAVVGFQDLTETEIKNLEEDRRSLYFAQLRDAEKQAIDKGLFDSEFAYWRKFNHLHGWMEQLYLQKGGTSDSFNCNNVRLNLQDLERLEALAKSYAFTSTQGFFFGPYEPFDEEDQQTVLAFIAKARTAMAKGMAVFYDSWW